MPLIPTDHNPHVVAPNELRHAVSRSGSPEAAEFLIRALDAGMGWDTATHAVAHGIAERFPSVDPREKGSSIPPRAARVWPGLAFGFIQYLLSSSRLDSRSCGAPAVEPG